MDYFIVIFSGILVFVIGQIILKFIIEPIYKQKEVIGDIEKELCYYRDICVNLKKENELMEISKKRKEIEEKFKKLGSQLISKTNSIPYYKIFAILGIVVKKQNIIEAAKELHVLININSTNTEGLSKSIGIKVVKNILELLNLDGFTKKESKKINLLK